MNGRSIALTNSTQFPFAVPKFIFLTCLFLKLWISITLNKNLRWKYRCTVRLSSLWNPYNFFYHTKARDQIPQGVTHNFCSFTEYMGPSDRFYPDFSYHFRINQKFICMIVCSDSAKWDFWIFQIYAIEPYFMRDDHYL